MTDIGEYAFTWCRELTEIELPADVLKIGNRAFQWTGLTRVVIPDGATSVGDYAFRNCTALKSIYIPQSVTFLGEAVFDRCEELTQIQIAPDNLDYWNADGAIISKKTIR